MVPGLISAGTTGRTYVKALVGDPDKWQDDAEILRCNPLCSISDRFRDRLLAERDAALKDETLIRKFCAYRLNVLVQTEVEPIVDDAAWQECRGRSVASRDSYSILGVDLGSTLSGSACACVWPATGRVEVKVWRPGSGNIPPPLEPISDWINVRRPALITSDAHRVTETPTRLSLRASFTAWVAQVCGPLAIRPGEPSASMMFIRTRGVDSGTSRFTLSLAIRCCLCSLTHTGRSNTRLPNETALFHGRAS